MSSSSSSAVQALNHTLYSTSPLIDYSPSDWSPSQIENANSTGLSTYVNATVFSTDVVGGSAKFSFNGTAIWLYGSKSPSHGKYYVTLDTYSSYYSGEVTADQAQDETIIYSATNLTYGLHEITLVNQGFQNGTTGFLDLDWIEWRTQIPSDASSRVIPNDDKSFELLPGPTWWSWGNDSNSYNGKLYYTQSPQAVFRLNFTGQAVALYGYLDINHGNYSCAVDGLGGNTLLSGKTLTTKEYGQLLCYTDGLDHGPHELIVHNVPVGLNTWFSVDYAEVWGDNLDETFSNGKLSGGAIAGIIVAVLLGLAGLGLFIFWFLKRRKRQRRRSRGVDRFGIDSSPHHHHNHDFDTTKLPDAPPADHITPFRTDSYNNRMGGGSIPLDSSQQSTPATSADASRRSFGQETETQHLNSSQNSTGNGNSNGNPNDPFGVYSTYHSPSQSQSGSVYGGYAPDSFDPLPPNHRLRDSSYSATTSSSVVRQWSGPGGPNAHLRVANSNANGANGGGSMRSGYSPTPTPHTRHELDAGPLIPLVEDTSDHDHDREDGEEDNEMREAEGRAAAGGTLPPLYSQIAHAGPSANNAYLAAQQAKAAAAEQKRAPRGGLHVVDE